MCREHSKLRNGLFDGLKAIIIGQKSMDHTGQWIVKMQQSLWPVGWRDFVCKVQHGPDSEKLEDLNLKSYSAK